MKNKTKIISALLLVLFIAPLIKINTASAAVTRDRNGGITGVTLSPDSSQGITGVIVDIGAFINLYIIPLIIGLAVLFFIFGLFKYVTAGGDEKELVNARNTIIWGIVIIAVMISVWGLINLVVSTFGLSGGKDPNIRFPQVGV